jgi:hypothetical protein
MKKYDYFQQYLNEYSFSFLKKSMLFNYDKAHEIQKTMDQNNWKFIYNLNPKYLLIKQIYNENTFNITTDIYDYKIISKLIPQVSFTYMITKEFEPLQIFIKKIINVNTVKKESGIFLIDKTEKQVFEIPKSQEVHFEDWINSKVFDKVIELNQRNINEMLQKPLIILFCNNQNSKSLIDFRKVVKTLNNNDLNYSYMVNGKKLSPFKDFNQLPFLGIIDPKNVTKKITKRKRSM